MEKIDKEGRVLRAPRNTTKEFQKDPSGQSLGFLAEALIGGPGFPIERQEAEGQRDMVHSDTLPIRMDAETKAQLQQLGFIFIGPASTDPKELFQFVTFPEGWKKAPTDHYLYTNIVDPKGHVRGNMFYKAAFYDRDAFMGGLTRRYTYRQDYSIKEPEVAPGTPRTFIRPFQAWDNQTNSVIFTIEPPPFEPVGKFQKIWDAEDYYKSLMKEWLIQQYPDHENPLAYWE